MADSGEHPGDRPPDVDQQLARFSHKLVELAQRQLDRRLAPRLDGEDVVQSAFRTFLRRNARGEFQIDGAAQLWKLLVHLTLTKARSKGRFHSAARRNPNREALDGGEWIEQVSRRDPSAEEAVVLVETVEILLNDLPEWYSEVLGMRLEDRTATEISGQIGLSRQSVQRSLRVMRDRLEQQFSEDFD